ncbi:Replication protein A 32 kDa subunit B [Bienertia sinuspersici]
MYANQFDGNAAFSGGGFMPSQATQSTEQSFSSSKNRDTQGIVPLTVKQLNEALLMNSDSNNISVDGVDVNNVTLVGMVFDKVERVTDVGFFLDDGTGRINVLRWINEPCDTNEMANIKDKMYVRVHANLKGFQGKRQLVAFAVRPMTDFNELSFHFLECMYVHMYNTKLRATNVSADPQVTSSVNGIPFRGYQGTQQSHLPGQFSEMKGVEQLVMSYLQQPAALASTTGVHVNELVQRLNIPLDQIMSAIRFLDDEGHVYSTIDDEHYKSTANA